MTDIFGEVLGEVHYTKPKKEKKKPKKAKPKTNMSRSLDALRERGYTPFITEKWNAHAFIRQDLFGFVDILALKRGEVLGVQCCSDTDRAAHREKIANHENVGIVRMAGIRIELHSWGVRKSTGEMTLHIEDLS